VVYLSHVSFVGNLASGGGWVKSGGGGNAVGGALFSRRSQLFVSNSSFASNAAAGGSCLIDVGEIGGPSGDGLGGSVYLSADSTAILQHCCFATNLVKGGDGTLFDPAGKAQGGAIFNLGTVQTQDSLFSSNTCRGGDLGVARFIGGVAPSVGQGGAIFSTNILCIDRCTFAGNVAAGGIISSYHAGLGLFPGASGDGGALWSSGELRATNATFAGNRAAGGYAATESGAANGGAVCVASGTGVLVNVTISGNRADGGYGPGDEGPGPANGGGLSCTNATVTLRNSILAYSASGGDAWGVVTDAGYNICSDATANFSAEGSLNNVDPRLGPLADNGGPTPTMLLLNGSPAQDAIPVGFPALDQRGVMRPQGVAADIGAVEGGKVQRVTSQIVLESSRTEVRILIQATSGSSYRLLASPDLTDWTGVAFLSTNSPGPMQFTQPVLKDSSQFFQVVSP